MSFCLKSLYLTISAAVAAQPPIVALDLQFDLLVKELFNQLLNCYDQQYAKTTTPAMISSVNKNQNELLRCFAELGIFI